MDEVMGFTIYEVQCAIFYLPASVSEPEFEPTSVDGIP